MESLFPQQRPADASSRQQPPLISFKAGKCVISERQSNGKFSVTPDKRRGTLSMSKSPDGLMHFRWTDRSTGILEDHRIVFPDEVSFKKCRTGRETDRVYLLKFTHAQQHLMFWMQDKSSDKDAENAGKINEYANNPAAADAAAAALAGAAAAATAPVTGSISERWAQLMGLPGGAAATAPPVPIPDAAAAQSFGNLDLSSLLGTAATPAAQRGGLTSEDLQRAMIGIGSTPGAGAPEASRTSRLEDILSADAVIATGILNDPAGQLSGALESDNINSVMANFNIDPSPGMEHLIRGDGVGAFLSAIQADVDASAAPAPAAPSSTNGNTVEEKENDGSSDTKMDEA